MRLFMAGIAIRLVKCAALYYMALVGHTAEVQALSNCDTGVLLSSLD